MVKMISTGEIDRIPAARVQRLTIANVDDTIRFIDSYADSNLKQAMKYRFLDKCTDEQKSQVAFFCISNHEFDIIDYILGHSDFPDRMNHIRRLMRAEFILSCGD
ncbi:MAG: hypothetical protein EOO38_23235 [Cytophagaceae bacterium]|nr:MAG: hypothetical protein EOO38_23235 [Cytophagaceae bacterium]